MTPSRRGFWRPEQPDSDVVDRDTGKPHNAHRVGLWLGHGRPSNLKSQRVVNRARVPSRSLSQARNVCPTPPDPQQPAANSDDNDLELSPSLSPCPRADLRHGITGIDPGLGPPRPGPECPGQSARVVQPYRGRRPSLTRRAAPQAWHDLSRLLGLPRAEFLAIHRGHGYSGGSAAADPP